MCPSTGKKVLAIWPVMPLKTFNLPVLVIFFGITTLNYW